MSQIIFRLTETMARYKVSVKALTEELDAGKSTVSKWRQGKALPSIERLNHIMTALKTIGDPDMLQLYPLRLSDLLEWREDSGKKQP